MSIFSLMAVGGTGFGPVYAGWIEINPNLEWKWIQWILMMQVIPRLTGKIGILKKSQRRISAFYLVLLSLVMRETRKSIILTRMAKSLRKITGDHRYRARVEDERASLANLIFISCTRPVRKLTLLSR